MRETKVRNETTLSALFTLTQHSLGVSSQSNKTGRKNKKTLGKEEVKLFLFLGDMILYLKDLKSLPKTPKHQKHLQQGSRIQNQFTKISSLSVYQQ
jgi:hypothetical protein